MQITLQKDDPRAARMLELARAERTPENRRELEAMLREIGVPEASIRGDQIQPSGTARLGMSELPGRVECQYEVLGGSDIMVIRKALPQALCSELIAVSEHVATWAQGGQVSGSGESYVNDGRTSRNSRVRRSDSPFWARWEAMLEQLMGDAARLYAMWNRHCSPTRQDGWEVIRYEPGQQFGLHVDQVAGHATWGQRQLSAILYLNDDYEGGATLFPRQGLEVKPEAGSIALFPPFWTHPHEGSPPKTGTKYVVVGWFYP